MSFKIVLMGPQGAGKGSVASLLKKKLGIPHISIGDLLRETTSSNSDLGLEIQAIMKRGELVSLDIIGRMLKDRLDMPDCADGFLLDGFPRDESQAQLLDSIVDIHIFVLLQVTREVSIKRLSARLQCSDCGAIFNLETKPPQVQNICDDCQGSLYQREDDKGEAIERRLDIYEKETRPLIDRYVDRVLPLNTTNVTPEQAVEVVLASLYKLRDLS